VNLYAHPLPNLAEIKEPMRMREALKSKKHQRVDADQPPGQQLELLEEAKISELLPHVRDLRLEASGVVAKDGFFYVIFDDSTHIGCIRDGLTRAAEENHLIRQNQGCGVGYEDITYDPLFNRFYLLIESLPHFGNFMAKVEEYDERFRYVSSEWLDFPLDQPNKGLEGLTCIHQGEKTYLLGLCEGNRCKAGAAGRKPGGGRIQIFSKEQDRWDHVGTMRLPKSLWFEDYSSLAVVDDRIAVISQSSSAAWVGRFSSSNWEVVDEGSIYRFPLDERGEIIYCNVEGISRVDAHRFVVVSDKAKVNDQSKRCCVKDQSIHVFRTPGRQGRGSQVN
jgi:hypothetical protein